MKKASGPLVIDKTTLAAHVHQCEQATSFANANENLSPNKSNNNNNTVNSPAKMATTIGSGSDLSAPLNGHLKRVSERSPSSFSSSSYATRLEILPCAYAQARRHLYMKPTDVAAAIDARIERMARNWTENNSSLAYSQFAHPGQLHLEPVPAIGRIVCDTDAPLNSSSLLLEASRALGSGYRVPLDISALKLPARPFCLFPGQIVMLEGTNPDGKCFKASRVLQSSGGWLMQIPRLPESYADYTQFEDGLMSFMCASGPFSPTDRIDFSHLTRVLTKAVQFQPEVLLLAGPFVDFHAGFLIEELPERVFEREVVLRLRDFTAQSPRTRLVLLPSLNDAIADCNPVFPHSAPNWDMSDLRATVLPNPGVFFINEVCFVAGNDDILAAIANDSILVGSAASQNRDAASAICASILHQGSLYPVSPAGSSGSVDYTRWEQLELLFAPDVILLPSSLPALARTIPEDNCIVVNPANDKVTLITVNPPSLGGGDAVDWRASRIRVDFI